MRLKKTKERKRRKNEKEKEKQSTNKTKNNAPRIFRCFCLLACIKKKKAKIFIITNKLF